MMTSWSDPRNTTTTTTSSSAIVAGQSIKFNNGTSPVDSTPFVPPPNSPYINIDTLLATPTQSQNGVTPDGLLRVNNGYQSFGYSPLFSPGTLLNTPNQLNNCVPQSPSLAVEQKDMYKMLQDKTKNGVEQHVVSAMPPPTTIPAKVEGSKLLSTTSTQGPKTATTTQEFKPAKRKVKRGLSDEEAKRQKRLETNRKSAQLSRMRKKERLKEMEQRLQFLEVENKQLKSENNSLKVRIRNLEIQVSKADEPSETEGISIQQTRRMPSLTESLKNQMNNSKAGKSNDNSLFSNLTSGQKEDSVDSSPSIVSTLQQLVQSPLTQITSPKTDFVG